MSILTDKNLSNLNPNHLHAADDREAVAESRSRDLTAAVSEEVNASVHWAGLVRPFQKRLVRRRIAVASAMVLGVILMIACVFQMPFRPLEATDYDQMALAVTLGVVGCALGWGSLGLLLFLFDPDRYSLHLSGAEPAASEMRASGIKLLGISANSFTATLVGGDGVTARTDRIDESLPRSQALLDSWAAEDATA